MAIYHFSSKPISRGKGQSVVASAAYRAGEKLYDEKQEKGMNYSKKQDVLYKEIFLPEGAPKWMLNREKLWNYVERIEGRKDAQLAREIQFSLPRELSEEQNIELAKEFVRNEFISRGMVADLCIHGGKGKDGEEQPHAHVLLSLREVTEEGFGLKERSWNAKENLMLWRESWAEHANRYLALNGIDQRIDHRSLKEQGIELEPQKKLGTENLRIYEQRMMEHSQIARDNGEKILEDPTIALKAITYHQSTFTHHDLARFINRHTIDEEQFKVVYEKVKNATEIVFLGKDEQGRERFSMREMVDIERGMMENVCILEKRSFRGIEKGIKQDVGVMDKESGTKTIDVGGIEGKLELSDQQQKALEYIVGEGSIKCLVGYAGTGKSCLLDRAREIWEQNGYRVHGVTLAGIAAEKLEYSSGIESRTFASRKYYWDKGEEKLGKKDILVVDEAGMLGSRQLARIIEEVKEYAAKVILIGDPQQLQAIEAGAAFRAIIEKIGYLELTEIWRQLEPWQKEATIEFALRHTAEALRLYEQNGCINYHATQAEAKEALVNKWNKERLENPEKSRIMLAHTRRDVAELNEMARDCKKDRGELGEGHTLEVSGGIREFAVGDRIYFLQNNRDMGVKNGTLGTIEKIDRLSITVNVDSNRVGREEQKQVTFSLDRYNHISLGYAATIHKYQGGTVDRSYILASKYMDNHLAYVGMSRHREKAELFLSKEEFANKQELEQVLGRDRSKDLTVDYLGIEQAEQMDLGNKQDQGLRGVEVLEKGGSLDFEEKTVAELIEEMKERSRERLGQETSVQKHVREIKEITQRIQNDPERVGYNREIRKHLEQVAAFDRSKAREKAENVREQKEIKSFRKEESIARGEIGHSMMDEMKARKQVEKYYGLEEKYREIKAEGVSRYDEVMASSDMRKCARELCKDDCVMDYLKNNDRDLFKQMNELKQQETMRELQKELELSL